MKGIAIEEFGGRDKLLLLDLPVPAVGAQDVLIQVKAAGVNPVDWKIREGFLRDMFPHEFPVTLGWDVAGIVTQVGAEVTRFKVSDEVYAYCRTAVIHSGAYAQYIALPEINVALKPHNLSFEEAATVPLAALTAYQSLFDAAGLQPGESVLIHAAAGGVGGFAVQLARTRGAKVFGTASPSNHEYVKSLGADVLIDYNTQDFRQVIRETCPGGVDVVLDCVGGDVVEQSTSILNAKGRMVTITEAELVKKLGAQGVNIQFVFVSPNSSQLHEITGLTESGKFTTHVSVRYALEEAAKAHELLEGQHVRGKVVLSIE